MWLVLLPTAPADVVYGFCKSGVNVAIVLCSGLAAEVSRGGYDGFLEAVAQLVRERLVGDAQGDASVVGNQVGLMASAVAESPVCSLNSNKFSEGWLEGACSIVQSLAVSVKEA